MKNIYYKKTLPTRKVKLANFNGVSKEWYSKTLPIDFAAKQENLCIVNGSLVASKSPKSLDISFEQKIEKLIPYYDGNSKIIVATRDKFFVLSEDNGKILTEEIDKDFEVFDVAAYKYGEENFLIFATDKGLKKFENGKFEDSEIEFKFATICNHYYRIFGAEHQSKKLLFSDDFAPFNWTQSIDEGGYINLPYDKGDVTDLISFNQFLIVCEENGFAKITAYSEQEDFSLKSIAAPSNIIKGSVVDCGKFIMFATENGLGIFDGYNCVSVAEEISDFLKNCQIEAQSVGEYCYFLCKNQSSKIANSYLIAYNTQNKSYHFITSDNANSIAKVIKDSKEYLLVCYDYEIKVLLDESSSVNKIWKSGSVDFGMPSEFKLLKKIVFGGKTNIDLKINVDGKNYFFAIAHQRSFLLNLKGKQFEIEIVPRGRNINVPSPVLEYQVLEES